MEKARWIVVGIATGILLGVPSRAADQATVLTPGTASKSAIIAEVYPGLASGGLTHARPAALPQGTLVKFGNLAISAEGLADEMAKAPAAVQGQLKKNAFFLAEQMFTQQLILQLRGQVAIEAQNR